MSTSQFCTQQRQKERQRLKKFLIFGFTGSTVLHGIMAYALPRWSFKPHNQAKEPMELIIVNKPKPKPKVESKPIEQPQPKPLPKAVRAETLPPPIKPPKPVRAQTPPPKPIPAPKKVLTTSVPTPSQPTVSAPVENTPQASSSSSSSTTPSNSSVTSAESSSSSSNVPSSTVATNSALPLPEKKDVPSEGITCVSNCEPEYPSTLEGIEGSAGVKLTIDKNGNVIGAELANADGNSQVNRQALLAARQMQFSSPGNEAASVRVKIDFTVEGSEYDRLAREEQERKEQEAKERQKQEVARQQQLEMEQQARQEEQERERQARQQQESTHSPVLEVKPDPKPLPTLSPEELDEERLRQFRERMENYRKK